MTDHRPDWAALWRSGELQRLIFISLGIVFHAGAETMISTILPAMVSDIGGVQFTGWTFAVYEVGAVLAGAATGRLCTYWTVRTNMILAALVFALGSVATALAPGMDWALGGRLLSGFGGGALVALSMVAVQRYFPARIWPQMLAVLSVVWGVSAFTGPLFGGLVVTALSWRWAFGLFAIAAVVFAAACTVVLRGETLAPSEGSAPGAFPFVTLGCLALGITSIAAAGVETQPAFMAMLIATGLAGIAFFFWLDSRNAASRLFPAAVFRPLSAGGSGFLMVSALAVSTISFAFYGPLLLAALHGLTPVTTGLIIASESIAWSVMSILVANTPKHREAVVVRSGAAMIAAGVAGCAWAVPSGSIPALVACATLQGGGFGIAWPFVSRLTIEASPPAEKEITASAFSTLQRIGYALGGAIAGIIANANGFSQGFSRESAATAAAPLFLYFVPVALLGCYAAFRLTAARKP